MALPQGQMARRMIDDQGHSVDVKTFEESGTDDYGDPTYNETTTTVTAIIAKSDRTPNITLEQLGDAKSFPVQVHIKDDVVDISSPSTGKPVEIVDGNDEYEVQAMESAFGTIRLSCRRKRK